MNVRRLDAQDVSTLQKLYKAEDFDFRLKPGSAAVDRGVVLPNVTDGFAGRAPDLGALEFAPVRRKPADRTGPRRRRLAGGAVAFALAGRVARRP